VKKNPVSLLLLVPLGLLACIAVAIGVSLAVYRPDRPVPEIIPGSSPGPAFVVQIIRPRLGLPLGGIVPPETFGQEAHLGFDDRSAGASVDSVAPGRIALSADGWKLVLAYDADGRAAPATRAVFEFVFEERPRKVRCRPGDPVVGTVTLVATGDSAEVSGSFDIELARCEDAESGAALGWPPKPLILHGSFDRLPLGAPEGR